MSVAIPTATSLGLTITSGTVTSNTTYTSKEQGTWVRWGHIVIAHIDITPTAEAYDPLWFGDKEVASRLPGAASPVLDLIGGTSVDNVSTEPLWRVTAEGKVLLCPRAKASGGTELNATLIYICK